MKESSIVEHQDFTKQNIAMSMELWIFVLFTLLMLLSALTFSISPTNGEDYALSKPFTNASIFERASWAIERSILQSTHWNARLGEQLAIFWMAMPRVWFSIANLIFMSLLAFLLALFATPQEKWNRNTLMLSSLLVIAAFFLLWPRLEIFFWRTTAAGYLQPLVMTLLLLLPFYSSRACQLLLSTWPSTALLVLLGLLCGLSFENVPPALLPYMALITCLHFKEKTEFRIQLGLMVLIYLLGWALLMIAPSTHTRTAYYISALNIPPPSLDYFLQQILAVSHAFVAVSAPLLGALITVLLISLFLKTKSWRQPARFYLLLVPAALCIASVVKAPYIEPRAFTLAWTILIILIVRFAYELLQQLPIRWAQAVTICLGIVSIGLAAQVFSEYLDYSRQVSRRIDFIMEKQNSNECKEGLSIQIIPSNSDIRLLNNREDWVASNLPQVSQYFNCKLRLSAP
ncbi:DUF6056 family protein [Pseudomonas sp. BE134]|uniref:DUF6056 family protein n=1 Tax=Pseudomonas sp. BE134 TaxID=2817843 RepID=UPI00285A86B1|nr:DUF6056 family protein [Pseudomonas sp. BE134]MDR6929403.1 hypothetical protein [Pseudomonas sp. BE134]